MSTQFSNRPVTEQSHEEHVAAGRKGGQARGHQRQNDDDNTGSPAKRSRSMNGNQGNQSRGGNGNGKMSLSEAGRKGGQTRAKNAGQNSGNRGGDYDPDADKYGYDEDQFEGDDSNDGIAMHTRSHDNGNNNDDDNNMDDDDDNQGSGNQGGNRGGNRRSGSGGGNNSRANAHSDFEPGKNPNRQAVSRRVARERGHEAFVEMGRKGGQSNAGIHADLDYDDMDSFRSHPEQGVPAKNPNRVRGGKQAAEKRGHDELSEMGRMGGQSNAGRGKFGGTVDMGEDDSEPFNERDLKSPNRMLGGIRAASKQSHESFVERGRMGAEARFGNGRNQGGQGNQGNQGGRGSRGGNNNQQDDDDDDQNEDNDDNTFGKDPVRVQAGKKAAQTRAENGTQYHGGNRPANQQGGNGNNRSSSGNGRQSQGRSNNRQQDDDDDDNGDDMQDDDNNGDDQDGKNPNRVRGGQKAAETRARNGTQSHSGSRPSSSGGNSNSGRNSSGGNNRGRNSRGGNNNQQDDDDDDDNFDDMDQDDFEAGDEQGGKNPNRVRGGKKAASHFTHEELSERARRAAQTRAQNGTQSRGGSGGNQSERYNDNMDLEEGDDDDNGDDDDQGKDPVRVQAGKKAAQTRAERGTQSHQGSRGGNSQGGNGRGGNNRQ